MVEDKKDKKEGKIDIFEDLDELEKLQKGRETAAKLRKLKNRVDQLSPERLTETISTYMQILKGESPRDEGIIPYEAQVEVSADGGSRYLIMVTDKKMKSVDSSHVSMPWVVDGYITAAKLAKKADDENAYRAAVRRLRKVTEVLLKDPRYRPTSGRQLGKITDFLKNEKYEQKPDKKEGK